MIQLRTIVPSVTAALVLTLGSSALGTAEHALAAGPHTQAQMMPAHMNPGMDTGMGMGMPMGGMLPIYTPAVSSFLGMPSYPMSAPASSYGAPDNLPLSYSSGSAPMTAALVNLQQLCHQYQVGLQYNTQADDLNLDAACGVTGDSTDAASSSAGPTQPMGQPYP